MFLVKQLAELKGAFRKTASVSGFEAQRGSSSVWRPDLSPRSQGLLFRTQGAEWKKWKASGEPRTNVAQ